MSFSITLFYCIFLLYSTAFSEDSFLKNKTIVGCEAEKGYPPFIYKNKSSGNFEGYSVDLINLIFKDSGAKVRYELLPWKRCLSNMNIGENMDIVLAAASTEERRKKYIFSNVISKVHLAYFYDTKRYPNGLRVTNPNDLNNLKRVCGMRGFVYESYGLSKKIMQSADNFQQLVNLLVRGRCDAILIRYEVFKSLPMTDAGFKYYDRIKGNIVPWLKDNPINFYFLARKNSTYHKNLIFFINMRIKQIRKSGQLKTIKEKYGFIVPDNQ